MVRKKDLGKVFFIYLCLFSVCPAHPCGENPLRGFMSLSRISGKSVNNLLQILHTANWNLYERLEREWQLYANCVGMVDTGYFKRSARMAKRHGGPLADRLLPTHYLTGNNIEQFGRKPTNEDNYF